MGLKVLLADESTSIKKAFQLALADYAVEVKSVPSGLDVLSVSLDFMPDIIFADVLLTKKSGYEVCKEIKAHTALSKIPFILMWSHFMEFDMSLATQSGYTDKIEKPFDTETLRQKINAYVIKTKKHPLHNMIELPKMPQFLESESVVRQKNTYFDDKNILISTQASQTQAKIPLTQELHKKNQISQIETVEEDFSEVQLSTTTSTQPQSFTDDFEIEIETENYGDFEEVLLVKADKSTSLQGRIHEQIQNYLESSPVAFSKSQTVQQNQNTLSSKNASYDEQLMREEIRLAAEKICWQIIPDITEKIVREEITKLLSNIDKSI